MGSIFKVREQFFLFGNYYDIVCLHGSKWRRDMGQGMTCIHYVGSPSREPAYNVYMSRLGFCGALSNMLLVLHGRPKTLAYRS
jgi:hypothetical protein